MNGKGNYDSPKIERIVTTCKNQYASINLRNSYVLYCLDCDKYDSKAENRDFLEKAKKYCSKENDRRFVWFCRDIEDVFLGKQIDKNQKGNEAYSFEAKNLIKSVNISSLCVDQYQSHKSNLCSVLDEFLIRKKQ